MSNSPSPTQADQELFSEARAVADNAYAPYSGFHVGAALRTHAGKVYTGANVENGSYPLGVCAERTVLSCAASDGVRPGDIEAVAITASPCGGCRQWLLEFGVGRVVFAHAGGLQVRSTDELLPHSFILDT
jgi:cytidine deaminase